MKPYPVDEGRLGVLNYVVYKYDGAEVEYEAASNAYNVAYQNASSAEEAGETPVWPDKVDESQFIADSGRLDSERNESGKVSLKEGEVLVLRSSWGAITISIKKAPGLFMD